MDGPADGVCDCVQILDVKKKIQEQQTFPVEHQKIIFSGKHHQTSVAPDASAS